MSESGQENQSENPHPTGPPVSSGDAVKAGYQVGYKRPPIYTRFQPANPAIREGAPPAGLTTRPR
jgi:hypothetical protein